MFIAGSSLAGLSSLFSMPILGSSDVLEPSAALPSGTRVPQCEFVYEATVSIAPPQEFGATAEGKRRIIPITGGHFMGPAIRGTVLGIGADWNLARSDGGNSVEAEYYLRTDDGVTIRIVNRGVCDKAAPDDPKSAERFLMFTIPQFEAPPGKYDWMNRQVFVGTLSARRDVHDAVVIRVFKVV
jgi:hypothetical protein